MFHSLTANVRPYSKIR